MRNNKGIILIFVLIVLAAFSLLGLGLSFRSRLQSRLSQYYAAEHKVLYLAKSKLNEIMFKIAQDNNAYDSYTEEWAENNSVDLENGGSIKVSVEDEDGKLDINIATEKWLDNMVASEELKNQIIENRPFLTQEDLAYLMNKNLYYAEDISKILNLVTTQGHDKLNVNTIKEDVLRSMPGIDRNTADSIISARKNEPIDNIETLKDLTDTSIDEYQTLNKILKTTSNFYTVRIQVNDKKNKINKSFRITLKKDFNTNMVEIIRWLEQ